MKILIISHNSFSKNRNNGKTLASIFSSFDRDNLCQLFFTPVDSVDYDACSHYYLISDKDAFKSIFFRNSCGCPNPTISESTENIGKNTKPKFLVFLKIIRSFIWFLSSWYSGGLKQWLFNQKPDLIFYVGGDSFFSHFISISLSKRLNIPLTTYFTDDYVINTPRSIYRYFLRHVYKKTINRSSLLFAIGNEMSNVYSDYYDRCFYPIMNIVDIQSRSSWERNDKHKLNICYYGGLHLGRAHEIFRFAKFLSQYTSDFDFEICLKIFSFTKLSNEELEDLSSFGIQVLPPIIGDELKRSMTMADVFLHVESVEEKFHSLTKLSVSTKIPEYMSMQKPIIAYGPADVASFRVISSANPTLVIDDVPDVNIMKEQGDNLRLILSSEAHLKSIACDNFKYASTHFNKAQVAYDFKNKLVNLLN